MQLLVQNYPKSIYGMSNFKNDQADKKSKIYRGQTAKLAKLQLIEGPIAKVHLTMMISSSNYPKFIYGMPLFDILDKFRFEFENQIQIEFKSEEK